MLGVSSYTPEYVQHCRSRVDATVKAYKKFAAAAKGDASIAAFEPLFFHHMVLTLDEYFVHRLRGTEGKDGNPLNEVRIIVNSLMVDDGVFTVEKVIKYKPEASVLGYAPGDRIALDEAQFTRLSKAYFEEMVAKFT